MKNKDQNSSTSNEGQTEQSAIITDPIVSLLVRCSFIVSIIAVLGSLWLSVGMGLKACPLCFYQRSFVMAVAVVLGLGLFYRQTSPGVLNRLAFPVSIGGLGVALFHVYLEFTATLECPVGVLGLGSAPQQSVTILLILVGLMGFTELRDQHPKNSSPVALLLGIVLGLLLSGASIVSAPPLPSPPVKAYETPLDTCRPPFRSSL